MTDRAQIDKTTLHAQALAQAKTRAEQLATSLTAAFEELQRARVALAQAGVTISLVSFDQPALEAAWRAYSKDGDMPLMPLEQPEFAEGRYVTVGVNTPQQLAEKVRRGIGAGDRLVPGTMSQQEADALPALAELVRLAEEADTLRAVMPKPDVFFTGLRAMGWAEPQARALVDDYAAALDAVSGGSGRRFK